MIGERLKLKDVCLRITKGTTPSTYGFPFVESGINFVKAESILEGGGILPNTFAYIDEATHTYLKRSILCDKDILISIAGAKLGKCGYLTEEYLPANTNQAVGIVRADPTCADPKFLYYNFVNNHTYQIINSLNSQAAQPNLNLGQLGELEFQFPSITTQRRIASILSAYDDLIENNLKRIRLLEEKAFLRYKADFEFFKPSNEINNIPEGWHVKRADEIFKINIGKTPPREQSEWFNDAESVVKWVSIKDLNNSTVFINDTSETVTEAAVNNFNMNVTKANTVLLSFKLTVGKVAISTADMTTNEAIAHFNIPDESLICPEYIYFYLKNFPFDSLGSTSSIGTAINSKIVKAMPVLLPSQMVMKEYKNAVENDFMLIHNLLKQNVVLREARDILLPRLMSGEIEV